MRKILSFLILALLCFSYITGKQRNYSITLIKDIGNRNEFEKNFIWLNFPILANYKFIENQKLEKKIIRKLSGIRDNGRYLKLSEWNIDSFGSEEKTIECTLYDHDYYLLTISINGLRDLFSIMVKKAEKEMIKKEILKISGFKRGETLTYIEGNIKSFRVFPIEISEEKKYYISIDSLKSISKKKLFETVDKPLNFKGYILYIPSKIDGVSKIKKNKLAKVVVNILTDIYGNTNILDFLSCKKKDINVLRNNLKKWSFDCWGLPTPQSFRTIFLFY